MIYIKKQKPEKEVLDKIAEIKNSLEWKQSRDSDTKSIRQCFDKLPKEQIRKNLLQEQHYLCAYCMKRIDDNPLYTTIEHWLPLSKNKDRALDYSNMVGCVKVAHLSVYQQMIRENYVVMHIKVMKKLQLVL